MMEEDSHSATDLISPCGMNCAICSGYLALKYNVKNIISISNERINSLLANSNRFTKDLGELKTQLSDGKGPYSKPVPGFLLA